MSWVIAMQDKLNLFEKNKVWALIPRPNNRPVINIKQVFRSKLDKYENIIRNNFRLVAKDL